MTSWTLQGLKVICSDWGKKSSVEDSKRLVANRNVKFVHEKGVSGLIVDADKGRVTQVITNLINNAVKFTNNGTISVRADQNGHEVLISVRDTGTGIDPEIMPRLFSKFASRSQSGTGLGLFISKSIIEAHGGRIWGYNNKNGQGATFSFSLPLVEIQEKKSSIA
ncbi:MAG: HAMP domain-containing histidine kinase [Thaumarchaeota archaeon]|nr:MAG: HAMP domain-containing histidine kinase [Nitrososphaerota archaeon]